MDCSSSWIGRSLIALSAMIGLTAVAMADTGSDAFNKYVSDLALRLQRIDNGSYWISTLVDSDAYERYLAAIGEGAGGPGLTETVLMARDDVEPLRTFNGYLRYLGQRIHADAGSAGPAMEAESGSVRFDRYVEELNFRLQVLREASESTGF